ncbi:MAG TPA: TetR/AcrR family transcriptional regulator [Roseiflexaceae bacterium]|nr:TetR/AcrR family transcriptional regulator [Roseiflexaceae bacterium]
MGESQPPRRVYSAHREKQRRHILATAQTLFDQHGIDRVTMADIIAASGLMRSTIYQYFSNKDEIVWAIVKEIFERSGTRIQQRLDDVQGSALARIAVLLDVLADELVTHPEQVRFMAQFDALYARDWSAEQLLALEAQLFPAALSTILTTLVCDGIADGSLRAELAPELTMHSVLNAAIATQRRLASLGERIEQEYGQPIDRLFAEACRVILRGLQAP